MRVSTKLLLSAALVLPTAMTVVGSGGGAATAAGGTTCSKASGTATFKPPLPIVGDSHKVKPTITVKNAKQSGCKGGGVKSAKFNSLAKFHTATNCQTLLQGNPSPNPPTGTITTTWNTGATSTASITLNAVSGQPTQTHVTGKVTKGLFKGLSIDSTLSFSPKRSTDCTSTPLAQVTFVNMGPITIS
jgi:hypothetical protein